MDLAYAAHELRTPLALQRALLELALADQSADVAVWREVGEDVLRACMRQERVLDACVALARSGHGPRCYEPVDLAAIAADALRAYEHRSLTTVVSLEPAITAGDPGLVERLVANLVSNAIDHNVSDGRMTIATRTRSGRAILSVANSGRHVPSAELPRLFQPFQRLDAEGGGGIGLGLAIVQAVADAHGATVTARARRCGGLGIDVAFLSLNRKERLSCVASD